MEHFDAASQDGALILSARAPRALGIVPGRKATLGAEVSGGELIVRNADGIVQARALLRPFLPADGRSVVDDLIADRRAEAVRYEWEFRRDRTGFAPAQAVKKEALPPWVAETP